MNALYCIMVELKYGLVYYLWMAAIISFSTSSSLYQHHQNTLLSLGLSHCQSAVSNHFAFPITTQRKGR